MCPASTKHIGSGATNGGPLQAPAPRPRLRMFGIPIDDVTMDEAVSALAGALEPFVDPGQGQRPGDLRPKTASQACFVNADCINRLAGADGDRYREVLSGARFVFADGSGMRLAGRILGQPVRDNVNGTDLFPRLCALLAERGDWLFLLGGKAGVPEGVRAWIASNTPGLRVVGLQHGYFAQSETEKVLAEIRASGARVLLVAFGAPRQDLWIREHLPRLDVSLAIGVGGLFDFYSGRVPRAPLWVRRLGLEWSFRLGQEPGRLWRRYILGNPIFVARTLNERWRARRARRARSPAGGSKL